MSDWTRDYFDRGYGQRWGLHAPGDQVHSDAAGIWKLLVLSAGARVADVGCGHGRHALALAQRGARVVGADASGPLLSRARDLGHELGVPAQWVRADMRSLPFRSQAFDAALSMDAFGFFATDDEDRAVLAELARIVRPGGSVLMKVVNGHAVLRDLRKADREERDGQLIEISRTLSGKRMTERLRMDGPRGAGEYRREQRLYDLNELRRMLEHVGLAVSSVSANPQATPFDEIASVSIWVLSVRQAGES